MPIEFIVESPVPLCVCSVIHSYLECLLLQNGLPMSDFVGRPSSMPIEFMLVSSVP